MLEITPPSFGTAAIFDSVFPPHFAQVQQADATVGNAGFGIFERCNADPFCAGAFALEFAGFSPTDVLKRTFNELSLKTGNAFECAKAIGVDLEVNGLKTALGSVLFTYYSRMLAPPLIFRLNRCNSNDIQVLHVLVSLTYQGAISSRSIKELRACRFNEGVAFRPSSSKYVSGT